MFAEQVKSGALPPVDKRIPELPSIVKHFAGARRSRPLRRPGQHAGRQRARHAPDDALRQRAADRLRRPVQAAARHPRELRGQGQPRVHPEAARRPQVVGRRSRSRPRTSASSGKTSPTTRSCRRADRPSSCWSTASRPRSRSSIELTISYTWDKPNPYFIESQARAAPLFLFRPAHYLKKFHAQVHAGRGDRQGGQGRPGAAGCRSTAAST